MDTTQWRDGITIDPPESTRYACGLTFGEMKDAAMKRQRCVREVEYEPETGGVRVEQCTKEGSVYNLIQYAGIDGYAIYLCDEHADELDKALNKP